MPAPAIQLRVAIAHVFATGTRGYNNHGLFQIGLLPLVVGAEPQTWLLNPGRSHSGAVQQASQISNKAAADAPGWAACRQEVQAAFAEFDALVLLDRSGEASPERDWLEQQVVVGMERPPVGVALDELLGFFLPGEELDDAQTLKAALLADKTWRKASGYKEGSPQLPYVLLAMRRALRRALAVMLSPGPVAGLAFPVLALLREAVAQGPRARQLRAFRLLEKLSGQPDCCDEALPEGTTTRQRQAYRLPRPPAVLALAVLPHELLADWLRQWHLRSDGTAQPEIGVGTELSDAQVDDAFAALRTEARAAGHELKPRAKQQAYARYIAQAINAGGAHAVEAGTGTGKTFGYLVPALEYLRHYPTAAVVIATSTKNLQDQMQAGELPALLKTDEQGRRTGRYAAIRTALLKGKNCYLCADALAEQFYDTYSPALPDWPRALAWLYLALRLRDAQGELEGIPRAVERLLGDDLGGLRPLVEAETHCRHGDLVKGGATAVALPCVYKAHRLRADTANLVITNHHKLLSLPKALQERARVLLVDEADRFPDNLRSGLARSFGAQPFVAEVLVPLLGYDSALAPRWPGGTRSRPPEPLLNQLAARLLAARRNFYHEADPADRPAPGDATAELAYELLAEARLEALTAAYALHHRVAEAVADTPLRDDAQRTADNAWLAAQAAAGPIRQRRAVRAAQAALPGLAERLHQSWAELGHVGRLMQPSSRQEVAPLPFPLGETHWMASLDWAAPRATPQWRPVLTELRRALTPLRELLAGATDQLGQLGPNVQAALSLATTGHAELATQEPTPDQLLAGRVAQVAGRAQELASVLLRLLQETPAKDFIPILERRSERDPLAWHLHRQPFNLWPYLTTPDPAGGVLTPQPNEMPEAWAYRRQVARQRLAHLPGEPESALYEQFRTVVYTSATLCVEDSLGYFQRLLDQPVPFASSLRLGANFAHDERGDERVVASLASYLPRYDFKLSAAGQEAWRLAQCRLLLALVVAFEGRTLVLFTSNADLDYAAQCLRAWLPPYDIELLVQSGASQWEIRRFGQVEQSVLLGVDRFWTGVDFAGRTLAQVVVWRAPVPNKGEVLSLHRQRYLTEAFYWQHFGRPAARLKLRQGFGRLVRREKDQGAFVVLDARLQEGKWADLLAELPLACEGHPSAEALLRTTIEQALPLPSIKLQTDLQRRELTLEKLRQLAEPGTD